MVTTFSIGYSERLVVALVTSFELEASGLGRARSRLAQVFYGLGLAKLLRVEHVPFAANLRNQTQVAGLQSA